MKNLKLLSLGLLLALSFIGNLSLENKVFADQFGNVDHEDCVNINRNLKYRWWWVKYSDANTNGEVSILQDFLSNDGYYSSVPNGIFDLTTKTAVRKFQKANELYPDGSVGPITRLKLNALYGCENSENTPIPAAISSKPNNSISTCNINSFNASINPVIDTGVVIPTTKLSWETKNCDIVYISGGASPLGTLSKSGTLTINTPKTTTFTLHASTIYNGNTGNTGVEYKNLTVVVKPALLNNCTINSFTASPNPVIDVAYEKPMATLSWSTENCDVVYLGGGAAPLGTLDKSGSLNINTPQTTTFTLYASTIYHGTSGNIGLDDESLVVTVIPGN